MKVDDFVALVHEYRALVDGAADSKVHAFLTSCARLLPRIYAAALELPDVEPDTEDIDSGVESPMDRLAVRIGRYDYYWEVFDPRIDGDEERVVCGQLSDDLADVYLDLVDPLASFEAGRVADAVWSWKFGLRSHYGAHIVSAMRAIHVLIHEHMPVDYAATDDQFE